MWLFSYLAETLFSPEFVGVDTVFVAAKVDGVGGAFEGDIAGSVTFGVDGVDGDIGVDVCRSGGGEVEGAAVEGEVGVATAGDGDGALVGLDVEFAGGGAAAVVDEGLCGGVDGGIYRPFGVYVEQAGGGFFEVEVAGTGDVGLEVGALYVVDIDVARSGDGDVALGGGDVADIDVARSSGVEDEGAAVDGVDVDGGGTGGGYLQSLILYLRGGEGGGGGEVDGVEFGGGDVEVDGGVGGEVDGGAIFDAGDVEGLAGNGDGGLPVDVAGEAHGVGLGLGVVYVDGYVAVDDGEVLEIEVLGDGLVGLLYCLVGGAGDGRGGKKE